MKQILQNLSNGETTLVDVPCRKVGKGSLLISSRNTLESAGTDLMLVDFGKASYIDKARQKPDKVQVVLDKMKTDGLLPTVDAVRSKLDQPLPLGYCNAGVVLESGVDGFSVGDRMVSNGNHSEVVRVSQNPCAKIPDGVDDESAAFSVGSDRIAGIRLIEPTLGETVVVDSGLGLIGLITALLRAKGCVVIGFDFDEQKVAMAREKGLHAVNLSNGADSVAVVQEMTGDPVVTV